METKRKIVDHDSGKEVSTAKKPRYSLESETKDKVIKFIAMSHLTFHRAFLAEADSTMQNIHVGIQIGNIVFSTYSILRMEASNIAGTLADKVKRTNPTVRS